MKNKNLKNTKTLVILAMFAAIEVVLAATPLGFIPLGVTRATTIHIPVIIGAIILGPKAGAILGGIFGITSLVVNTLTPTITSFVFTPFYSGGNLLSLVVVLVPRILIGVVAYYVYAATIKLTKKKTVSYAIAGVLGSMTNTILVMGGIYAFFGKSYAAAKEMPFKELFTFIMGVVGINGVPEAIVAGVLTVALCTPLAYAAKRMNIGYSKQKEQLA